MTQYKLTVFYTSTHNIYKNLPKEWKVDDFHFVGLQGLHDAMEFAYKSIKGEYKGADINNEIYGVKVSTACVWGDGYGRY